MTNDDTIRSDWTDPDDAPKLTETWFESADAYQGEKLIRRGRPKADNPKRQVSLRLDTDVIDMYRASGPGWQTRINDILRKAARL